VIWLNFLLKVAGGAATGYITNNIALNMLFKKYGPFGGVILETKEEFIENASELVEREIINHNTISRKLYSPQFEKITEKMLKDFLQNYLYQNTGDKTWHQVPGYGKSCHNIYNYLDQNIDYYVSDFIKYFEKNITLEHCISRQQINFIFNNLIDIVMKEIKENDELNELIFQVYQKIGQKSLDYFISPVIFKKISANIGDKEAYFSDINFNEIDKEQFLDQIKLQTLLSTLLKEIHNKKMYEIINCSNSHQAEQIISDNIRKNSILNIIKIINSNFIKIFEDVEMSLFHLIDNKTRNKLEKFIESELPDYLENIIIWLEDNKEDLEKIIEESASEVLKQEKGLKNKVKNIIFETFRKNIGHKFKIGDKIIDQIEQGTDNEQFSRKISQLLFEYLQNKSIGEIIKYLKETNILNIDEISIYMHKFIIRHEDRIYDFLTETLSDFYEPDFQQQSRLIQNFIKKYIITEEFLSPALLMGLKKLITNSSNYSISKNLDLDHREKEKLVKKIARIKTNTADRVIQKQNILVPRVVDNLYTSWSSYKMKYFLDKNGVQDAKNNLSSKLINNSKIHLKNNIKKAGNKQIINYYNILPDKQNTAQILNEVGREILDRNLKKVLQGNIKEAISDNMEQFSDQKIQSTVQDFMGQELHPITTLGAFLGGGAGIGLYFLNNINPVYSILTYGFIGFLTNVIALRMIFRPYDEKKIWGIKIPFTPGVVARNKNQFAQSMGTFIEEKLLEPEAVKQIFVENRQGLIRQIKLVLYKDDFSYLNNFLIQNTDIITERITHFSLNYIEKNKSYLAARAGNELSSNIINKINLTEYRADILDFILNMAENNSYKIAQIIQEKIKTISLKNVLTKNLINKIISNFVYNFISSVDTEKELKNIFNKIDKTTNKITDKKLNNFITEKQKNKIINLLIVLVRENNIIENLTRFFSVFIEDEFYSDKTFSEMFGGHFDKFLETNKHKILDWLYEKIIVYLQQERRTLKQEAVKAFYNWLEKEKHEKNLLGKIKYFGLETVLNVVNIDETIHDIVDDLIDNRIPLYLQDKKNEIKDFTDQFIFNLRDKKVKDIGLSFDHKNITDIAIEIENNSEFLKDGIEQLINIVLNKKVGVLIQAFVGSSINQKTFSYNNELSIIINHFKKNKQQTANIFSEILSDILYNILIKIDSEELFEGITKDNIEDLINKFLRFIEENEEIKKALESFLHHILDAIDKKDVDAFINTDYLINDLNKLLDRIIQEDELKSNLEEILSQKIRKFIKDLPMMINQKSKKYFLDLILESIFDSLEKHFAEIIKALDVKEITEDEINEMSPESIEELFNSFAARYFKRLKLYGWMGSGIGGLAELINILLS